MPFGEREFHFWYRDSAIIFIKLVSSKKFHKMQKASTQYIKQNPSITLVFGVEQTHSFLISGQQTFPAFYFKLCTMQKYNL